MCFHGREMRKRLYSTCCPIIGLGGVIGVLERVTFIFLPSRSTPFINSAAWAPSGDENSKKPNRVA